MGPLSYQHSKGAFCYQDETLDDIKELASWRWSLLTDSITLVTSRSGDTATNGPGLERYEDNAYRTKSPACARSQSLSDDPDAARAFQTKDCSV